MQTYLAISYFLVSVAACAFEPTFAVLPQPTLPPRPSATPAPTPTPEQDTKRLVTQRLLAALRQTTYANEHQREIALREGATIVQRIDEILVLIKDDARDALLRAYAAYNPVARRLYTPQEVEDADLILVGSVYPTSAYWDRYRLIAKLLKADRPTRILVSGHKDEPYFLPSLLSSILIAEKYKESNQDHEFYRTLYPTLVVRVIALYRELGEEMPFARIRMQGFDVPDLEPGHINTRLLQLLEDARRNNERCIITLRTTALPAASMLICSVNAAALLDSKDTAHQMVAQFAALCPERTAELMPYEGLATTSAASLISYDTLNFTPCENHLCTQHGTHRCERCKSAFYCSRACQVESWKAVHKLGCEFLQKAHASNPALTPASSSDTPTVLDSVDLSRLGHRLLQVLSNDTSVGRLNYVAVYHIVRLLPFVFRPFLEELSEPVALSEALKGYRILQPTPTAKSATDKLLEASVIVFGTDDFNLGNEQGQRLTGLMAQNRKARIFAFGKRNQAPLLFVLFIRYLKEHHLMADEGETARIVAHYAQLMVQYLMQFEVYLPHMLNIGSLDGDMLEVGRMPQNVQEAVNDATPERPVIILTLPHLLPFKAAKELPRGQSLGLYLQTFLQALDPQKTIEIWGQDNQQPSAASAAASGPSSNQKQRKSRTRR